MLSDPLHPDAPVRLKPLPLLIFSSRWLQLPLYIGLIVAQCVTEAAILWQTLIHMAFILSAIGIAWVDRMSQQRN